MLTQGAGDSLVVELLGYDLGDARDTARQVALSMQEVAGVADLQVRRDGAQASVPIVLEGVLEEAQVTNPIFGDEYESIVTTLIEARMQAGLSQRQLARRLGRSQSHVCMIERRQRRMEIVEFCNIAAALRFSGPLDEALQNRAVGERKIRRE